MEDILKLSSLCRIYSIKGKINDIKENQALLHAVNTLLQWEDEYRSLRKQKQLLSGTKLKSFSPMHEFDWSWPTYIDKELIEELFTFNFIKQQANVLLIGTNGLGKSMIAQNLVYEAAKNGIKSLFIDANTLLNDLILQENPYKLKKAILKYTSPQLLAIDEIGYLAFNALHSDLLFQIMNTRRGNSSTIITTNRSFEDWHEIFPNATSVTALVDRIIYRLEIIKIEGDSFNKKEFAEKLEKRKQKKKSRGG